MAEHIGLTRFADPKHCGRVGGQERGSARNRGPVHAGIIETDPMMAHTLKPAVINKGFDMIHAGQNIRSVVVY